MEYRDFLQKSRLALVTARVLGATDNPKSAEEAAATGEVMLTQLDAFDRREAICLAEAIADLSSEVFGETIGGKMRLDFPGFRNIAGFKVARAAALLAGFFDVHAGEDRARDWRNSNADADASAWQVVTPPLAADWDGFQFDFGTCEKI